MSEPTSEPLVAVVIETRACNIRMDGAGASEERAFALWKQVVDYLQGDKAMLANATGFQFEQADEAMHDKLPGGWAG